MFRQDPSVAALSTMDEQCHPSPSSTITMESPSTTNNGNTNDNMVSFSTTSTGRNHDDSRTNDDSPIIQVNLAEIVPDDVWKSRLQDKGVSKEKLPNRAYRGVQIPASGTKDDPIYYYDLACIAIDMMKAFYEQNRIQTGWQKLPKNKTNVKNKILGRLLALRNCGFDGIYTLDQKSLLEMLGTYWGDGAVSSVIHPNDRARVFGIIMTMEEYRPIFEKLALGVTHQSDIDDISMSIERMFQLVSISFNNEMVTIEMPDEAYDVPNIELIDLNDPTRIRITRDWMWCKNIWETTITQYKAILKDWYKGTGGGPGLIKEFETWDTTKFEKYNIDPNSYDHTDIASRPAILLNIYVKQREPYMTIIHIWDKRSNMLLSSKYDPLKIGDGEPGMTSVASATNTSSSMTNSTVTSTSSTSQIKKKRKHRDSKANFDINEVLGTMMKFCSTDGDMDSSNKVIKLEKGNDKVEVIL